MSDLPENWSSANILELSRIIRGVTYSKNDAHDESGKGLIPILRAMNITEHGLVFDDLVHVPRKLVKDEQIIKAGDVVAAISSGSITVVGKAKQTRSDLDAAFGAFCAVLRPVAEIEPRYFGHFFGTQYYRFTVSSLARGVNINNLKREHFELIEIPLAPLNEQKRIADKLDNLLARAESCQSHLERVPQILKRFRQSVLAAATSGRLTEDWREERGVNGKWERVKLSEVATSRLGKMLDAAKNRGELRPYLRNINVRWFAFELDDVQELRISADEAKTLGVRKGDVLVCEGGEPGRCAVWHGEDDLYLFQKALHRVRVNEKMLPQWLCYCLKSEADSGQLADYFTGTTIKHFTGVSINRFQFDLPSIEEQAEIVRRVEKLFAYSERLEARYTSASEHVERLTPSLLAKAFRGELVGQEAGDESAEVLVERIGKMKEEKL